MSAAGVFITVKSVFDPQAPLNQGSFRPIEVITPPGTIVNVQRPAPAGSHGEIRKRVIATMVGALAQMVPDKVAGDLCRTSFHNLIGGFDARAGREWVHYEWSAGGNGALRRGRRAERHGDHRLGRPRDGAVLRGDRDAHAAAGGELAAGGRLRRGRRTRAAGLSMQRRPARAGAEARYSLLSDGAMVPAFGVLGGLCGRPGRELGGTAGRRRDPRLRHAGQGRRASARTRAIVVMLRSAGGGGYGDPLQRPAERVADDVGLGFVSVRAAERLYGVVLAGDGKVDEAATARRRAEIRGGRVRLEAVAAKDCYRAGPVSRRRICRLNPADAARAGIGEGDLVELDTRRAAPLRAWAEIDAAIAQGTLPIDARGLDIQRAKLGEAIEVRLLRRAGSGPRDEQGI